MAFRQQYAAIAASLSGDNTVVSATAGKKIRVYAYNFTSNGAVNAKWKSGAATDITGRTFMDAAGKGKVCGFNSEGWFETALGEALILNLSAAVAVEGELVYELL